MQDIRWIITQAIGLFVLLWLMGAFEPVTGSPLIKKLDAHIQENGSTLRGICRGVWQGSPEHVINTECGK